MSDLIERLESLADCDSRAGEPLGKCMREAAIRIADLEAEVARLRESVTVWQPIKTAPNDTEILVAYSDGSVRTISADDNDYAWEQSGKWLVGTRPVWWAPSPAAPDTGGKDA